MAHPIAQWFFEIPVMTRAFVASSALITLAQMRLVNWFQLYYSYNLAIYWRIFTTFIYFGQFSLDWFFHMYFSIRYSRMLEEGSFRNKTADYAYFILLSCSALLVVSPLTNQAFLGNALTYVLAYLWSRREPYVRMNFLGLFDFAAPYLPWVLLGFNFLLTGSLPMGHMLGIAIGHLYYFLEDVWYEQHHGTRWLKTPEWFKRMFGQEPVDAAIEQHEHQD